jgi:nucleotide-binding universal stress UspA family protein
MLHTEPASLTGAGGLQPRLRTVVCGVDGLAAGREAARQAAGLAGPHGRLELVAVTPEPGHPLFLPLPDGAAAALADAKRIATSLGVPATARTLSAASAAQGLARASAGADVLVVGSRDVETAHGVVLGPVTEPLLAIAPCSVLVARQPPDLPLFDVIVVADGGSDQGTVASTAAWLAIEHRAETHVVTAAAAVNAAAAIGCGLIVTGEGADAARIAREATCSVLVIRTLRRTT